MSNSGWNGGFTLPHSPEERLRAEHAHMKRQIEAYNTQPNQRALVVEVGKAKTVLFTGQQMIEVATPPSLEIKQGDSVRIAQNGAIMSVVEGATAGGLVTVVKAVHEKLVEIEIQMQTRAVPRGALVVKQGDRVVVDQTGSVLLRVLPATSDSGHAFTPSEPVEWSDIGGLEDAKSALVEAVELPIKHKDLYARYGRRPTRGILLYGPPGCGKTLIAKATATAVARLHGEKSASGFLYVKGPELLTKFQGETEANIRAIFASARAFKAQHGFPAVVFIDEAEALLGDRSRSDGPFGGGFERTTVPQFLAEMDGLEQTSAIVLLATNRPNSLDPAVVRDGRIDRKIKVSRPNEKQLRAIFELAMRARPLASPADSLSELAVTTMRGHAIYKLATKTSGSHTMTMLHLANGAMAAAIVEDAATLAMAREMGGEPSEGITRSDITKAIEQKLEETRSLEHPDACEEFVEAHAGDRKNVVSFDRVTERKSGLIILAGGVQ